MVTRLRLTTRGAAADGRPDRRGVSSKRTDPPHRAELKTTCPKAGVVEGLWLGRASPSALSPLKKTTPIGRMRCRSSCSEPGKARPTKRVVSVASRIVLAHKEAVYQRLLLEAVTHARAEIHHVVPIPNEPVHRHA